MPMSYSFDLETVLSKSLDTMLAKLDTPLTADIVKTTLHTTMNTLLPSNEFIVTMTQTSDKKRIKGTIYIKYTDGQYKATDIDMANTRVE